MADIKDIVLFFSESSHRCRSAVRMVREKAIPISLVSIDSRHMREHISRLKHLSIKGVPTLVVIREDMNAEVYEGEPKVISWLKNAFFQRSDAKRQNRVLDASHQKMETKSSKAEDVRPSTSKKSKLDQIKELARDMEVQRMKALGIDENGNDLKRRAQNADTLCDDQED